MSVELVLSVVAVVSLIAVAVMAFAMTRVRRVETGGEPVVDPAVDPALMIDELKREITRREGGLDAKVDELNTKLAGLQESVTGREAALNTQVQSLDARMRGITDLFTNDRARGGWGEISLLNILDSAGLTEGRDYTAQFSADGKVPDVVVHLPGGRDIVIDSKFPVARYNEAMATEDPARRQEFLVAQGKELEAVAKTLVTRGYAELAAGGYVAMYLPSQAVYEAALEAHPEVIERLMRQRVVVAGPTSLFALVMHAGSLLTEYRSIQQADETVAAVRELHKRMKTFVDHLRTLQTALNKTVDAFNSVVGSWTGRVSLQLSRVCELGGGEPLNGPEPIDEAVREIPVERNAFNANLN